MEDNSPALSKAQQTIIRTGDEPALKGVNSQIVIERHAAYYAGNLTALIAMMSQQQQIGFKCWNVELALRTAERVLPIFEREVVQNNTRPIDAVRVAQRWLQDPNSDLHTDDAWATGNAATTGIQRLSTAARAAALAAVFTAQAAGASEVKRAAWNAALVPSYAARARFAASFPGGTPALKDWVSRRKATQRGDKSDPHWAAARRAQLRTAYLLLLKGRVQ